MKGIRKHKKSKKVWDEESKSWKSRWGKDRVDSLKEKWVIEVPDNAGIYFFTNMTLRSIRGSV